MAYRIFVNGFVVQAETPEEVKALLEPPGRPRARRAASAPKSRARARGASSGALDGRIEDALASGPMSPRELCAAVKAPAFHVRRCVRDLEALGVVRCEGLTSQRRVSLAKKQPKTA